MTGAEPEIRISNGSWTGLEREASALVRYLRQSWDFVLAAAGLVALAPLFLAIGLIIWLDSGRPIFFRQTRVGRREHPFLILKFRTMRTDNPGASVTPTGDVRLTPIGKILRRYKVDELPQLWNVLRGDMSLVGPRPEVPHFHALYPRCCRLVLASMKPGITGLASLAMRNESEFFNGDPEFNEELYRNEILPAKLNLEHQYLLRRSFAYDVKILGCSVLYAVVPRASVWRFVSNLLSIDKDGIQ